MSMPPPVFRFAPSPNGRLHLGHAASALLDHALARALGGRFLLRFEDIDTTRCRAEYEDAIRADLTWLGIDWDGEIRRQSDHFADYRAALDRLERRGLVRPSFATRSELRALVAAAEAEGRPWPRDPDGTPLAPADEHPPSGLDQPPQALRLRTARALAQTGPLHWREVGHGPGGETGRVSAHPLAWGDPVLARKEIPTSYHLSVVVDDALQGVTHVVRGRDLFWSTSVHRLLQTLLGLPAPVYLHHPLVTDADGRKLSKSAADTALGSLREAGMSREDVARLVGWDETARNIEQFRRELIADA